MSVTFFETIREISRELLQIQGPIRILDAIKWSPEIAEEFIQNNGQELPSVSTETYERNALGFRVEVKLSELKDLKSKIKIDVGEADGIGRILEEIVDGYILAVRMLEMRGTPQFGTLSRGLWGSTREPFLSNGVSLSDYATQFDHVLKSMDQRSFREPFEKNLKAPEVVRLLQQRFSQVEFLKQIEVKESDGIVADAAAGGESIKIRPDALFSAKDVDILEVHEGHTHVATSLNGRSQTYAQWLGYGPPRSTSTQEGLAVLMETLTMCTYPQRVKKINDRVRVIHLAEQGADAVEVYRFLREEGYDEMGAYRMMMRVFRGTDTRGGAPFTKDLSYLKGFIECYNFVFSCLSENASEHIRYLYAGKVKLDDIPILMHHARTGLIDGPRWLPPVFRAQDELASWFIFPAQLGQLKDAALQARFRAEIRQYADGVNPLGPGSQGEPTY